MHELRYVPPDAYKFLCKTNNACIYIIFLCMYVCTYVRTYSLFIVYKPGDLVSSCFICDKFCKIHINCYLYNYV